MLNWCFFPLMSNASDSFYLAKMPQLNMPPLPTLPLTSTGPTIVIFDMISKLSHLINSPSVLPLYMVSTNISIASVWFFPSHQFITKVNPQSIRLHYRYILPRHTNLYTFSCFLNLLQSCDLRECKFFFNLSNSMM